MSTHPPSFPDRHLQTLTDDQLQVNKALSSFEEFNIDDLLATVRSSSERVRIYAEGLMDDIIVSTHQTVKNNHKVSNGIHEIAKQTGEEVGELREKIEELLKQQKLFQGALDAVSGKNSLLTFLMEYLSKYTSAIVLGVSYIVLPEKHQSNLRKTNRQWSLRPFTSQAHR